MNDNFISPLEQSLRHIQDTLRVKEGRLREIEREAGNLRETISMLKKSAEQIKVTIRSLLDDDKASSARGRMNAHEVDLDLTDDYADDIYGIADDLMMPSRYNQTPPRQPNYNQNYNQRSVVPMHRTGAKHDIPAINPDTPVKSYRFRDKTIGQACTVLMREFGRPLHVNEIYNRLLEGGMIFTGNNPTISIAVSLNRNRRFRKVAPGTFDLNIREATAS
jgi:transcriptional regulator with XRE-family HTH domain